jgi:predicted transcriptional regulator
MAELGVFDEAPATARLLLIMRLNAEGPRTQSEIYDSMEGGFGVGRWAVDQSIRAAIDLGLITREKRGRFVYTSLTFRGVAAAKHVKDLENVLKTP